VNLNLTLDIKCELYGNIIFYKHKRHKNLTKQVVVFFEQEIMCLRSFTSFLMNLIKGIVTHGIAPVTNIKPQGCAIVLAHKTCLHDHITAI